MMNLTMFKKLIFMCPSLSAPLFVKIGRGAKKVEKCIERMFLYVSVSICMLLIWISNMGINMDCMSFPPQNPRKYFSPIEQHPFYAFFLSNWAYVPPPFFNFFTIRGLLRVGAHEDQFLEHVQNHHFQTFSTYGHIHKPIRAPFLPPFSKSFFFESKTVLW